jgi:hypothetical protein
VDQYLGQIPSTRVYQAPITAYVFSRFEFAVPSTLGLQLFNSAGKLTFDAAYRPLVSVGKHKVAPMTAGMDYALSLPTGRTYAAMMPIESTRVTSAFVGYHHPAGYLYPYNAAVSGFYVASNGSVHITEVPRTIYAAAGQDQGSITIVDVTGL